MKVYIGLGGNMGDPADNIAKALALIEAKRLGKVTAVSSLYKTEPVGIKDQPWFINAAAEVETELDPPAFHEGLKSIEAELGRPDERIKDGPRPIDLDILLWGDRIIDSPDLSVPHPRMNQRRFVLEPLAEIAESATHPVQHKSIKQLLAELDDPAVVNKQTKDTA